MAKNREQLNLEAEELGLDPLEYETKADLQAAIDAANPDTDEDLDLTDEDGDEESPIGMTTTETLSGEDDLPDASAPGSDGLHVQTTRRVEFTINGVHYEGTSFDFETEGIAKSRTEMLVASYGDDIIKQ